MSTIKDKARKIKFFLSGLKIFFLRHIKLEFDSTLGTVF